jgi:polyferredoxin
MMTTHREPWRRRGLLAWPIAIGLIVFYVVLYFEDRLAVRPLTQLAERLHLQSRWFLYSALYSAAMIGGAIYFLRRHGNSRYHRYRILVNVAVQVVLAFALPYVMTILGKPAYYFSILWPLKIEYLYPQTLTELPLYLILYSVIAALVIAPLLAIFLGKRWYCSWVCGCGALANTLGDPWRHLSDRSTRAWRFELISVHTVLILAVASTGIVAADALIGESHPSFAAFAGQVEGAYAFAVGSILAGVVGVGFYPLLGPRVWCRYFCPMAAIMGLTQKLGRFHIRVKKDMCISCGNCSTYCEMGIDVRSYAQNNESFTRASCVGCGMCAHVCPRGVLRLENATRPAADKQRSGLRIVDF